MAHYSYRHFLLLKRLLLLPVCKCVDMAESSRHKREVVSRRQEQKRLKADVDNLSRDVNMSDEQWLSDET